MSIYMLGGVKPSDIGLVVTRESQRPILPSTRDYTVSIPGRNGIRDFGADVEGRSFSFECAFIARDYIELQQRAESLARILVDSYGRPRTIDLVLDVHKDRFWKVRYSGSLELDRIFGLGTFTLPLVAFDEPYAQGPEKVTEVTITSKPYNLTIQADGDIRSQPIIVLTNTGTSSISTIKITNEYTIQEA